jgi:hypothetical protein
MWRSQKEAEAEQKGLPLLATSGDRAFRRACSARSGASCDAFQEIAISQNTSLAVVAPGIAEALLGHGLGLLAAIPAVIFYNKLSSDSRQPRLAATKALPTSSPPFCPGSWTDGRPLSRNPTGPAPGVGAAAGAHARCRRSTSRPSWT